MRGAWAIMIALVVVLGTGPVWAAEPPTLEERAGAIERASQAPDGERVVVGHISRELGVPVATLRTQRAQTGLGWGEILIAHRLSRGTGLTFDQVVAEFRNGKSWGDIARDRKIDVGKLASEVQQSQQVIEQHGEDRGAPRVDMGNRPLEPGQGEGRPGAGVGRRRY